MGIHLLIIYRKATPTTERRATYDKSMS